jgi:hypothetical protein
MNQFVFAIRASANPPGQCINMSRLPEISCRVVKVKSKVVVTCLIRSRKPQFTVRNWCPSGPGIWNSNSPGDWATSAVVDIRSERSLVKTVDFGLLGCVKLNKVFGVTVWGTVPVQFSQIPIFFCWRCPRCSCPRGNGSRRSCPRGSCPWRSNMFLV